MNSDNIRLLIVRVLLTLAIVIPVAQPEETNWYLLMWFMMIGAAVVLPHNVKKEDFE